MTNRAFAHNADSVLLSADSHQIITPVGHGAISAVRFFTGEQPTEVHISAPREDAYCLLFQRRSHPEHDFWEEDRPIRIGPLPRGSMSFVDLSVEPAARFVKPVDTLMFHMPRATFDGLTEGGQRFDGLRRSCEWGRPDAFVEQVEPLIMSALAGPAGFHRLAIDHLMLALAAHFAVTYGGLTGLVRSARSGLAPWQERQAKELIADGMCRDMSIQEIADECGLSNRHFTRAFKISTGRTPYQFLQERRIEKAERLLLESSLGLAEIALACGFCDQSHFTRVFTRMKSVAPGTWRRERLN